MNINIILPDEVRVYVETLVTTGAYSNISEYFLDLVQQDQKRKGQDKLEALLREGIDSASQEAILYYWQNLQESVLSQNTGTTDDA